ncbi:forkhead box protein L2 [Cordyceps fumosorosea ARSEF 2679]|uniref:Forkhead box protein L2 n=1 Tax=Cordyceps fumosorosea (strain ARSEF 2679) TaxID=1081104 RepID=A0A162JUX1_CORFA|nr:forkhead box protein L2 [Cordyceps fumosorosea ARSEF 2679]OAA74122.1 forkhead box protein L2 [Cordyceps fumosorosea ARSEF 2679]
MAKSTRFFAQNDNLAIFQDDLFDDSRPMTSHAPMPSVTRPPRRPLSASSSNVTLDPPPTAMSGYSPYKTKSSSPRSPLKASQGHRHNMISMAPPMVKRHTTDSLQKRPQLSKFKTAPQRPTFDLGFGKENVHPQLYPALPTLNISMENYYQQKPNANGKRGPGLMDAAPIRDPRAKKPKTDDNALPPHDSFPPVIDDGTKPPHSYAQLIGMAILRSPLRRLTLAQIYKWISSNYSFYHPDDSGWQNSIRHNLSLHKNFIKIERPKDDPGKGNYWGIEPGTEHQFLKEKPARKSVPSAENLPVMSTRLEPSTRPVPNVSLPEPTLPPQGSRRPSLLPPLPTSQATMSMPAEISSDATIPISDAAAPEDAADRHDNELPHDSMYSPLPANMHSSPPVPRHGERTGTPPPMTGQPASSITRSHKRKFASMDDSGYISSLESSAMRPNQKAMLLTSEADRPRINRGRAEEEIARLRHSSPFSPTKSRSLSVYGPVSSSPLRQACENQALPPLTPIVRMKPPVRPPPSASPNTNLRIHRDKVRSMLQSPLRRVTGVTDEVLPWSPAFNLDDTLYAFDDSGDNANDFDIFQDINGLDDNTFAVIGSVDSGSPVKRSAKRARLDRSLSSSGIDQFTGSVKKAITSAPLLRVPEHSPLRFLDTPSKVFEGLSSPSKLLQESPTRASPSKFSSVMLGMSADDCWTSLGLDSNEFPSGNENTEFGGVDILQGFQKIGGSNAQQSKPNRSNKPPLGRSYSTAF